MANPSPMKHLFDRLEAMRRDELLDRSRQYVTARTDVISYRSGNNFSEASESVPARTFGRFYFASAEIPELVGTLKQILPGQAR
jgi:hypothetical protein